jgi:hypothetical protein
MDAFGLETVSMTNRISILRRALPVLLALLIAAPLALVPPAHAQDARLIWSRVGGVDAGVILEDVVMLGQDLAWVAGRSQDNSQGYVYRMRLLDGRWSVERDGLFPAGLFALSALDAENVWAVGAGGLIVRRDPSGWRTVTSQIPGTLLRAIQMLGDGSEGWAGGARATDTGSAAMMLHYRDDRWEEARVETSPEGESAVAALHIAPGGGWAVGSSIWRLRGDEWRSEGMPESCDALCVGWLDAVRAIDGERAIAVGGRSGSCAICTSKIFVAERDRDGWRAPFYNGVPPETLPPPAYYPDTHSLGALYLTDAQSGLAAGDRTYPTYSNDTYGPPVTEIFGLRYSGGSWRYEQILPGASGPVNGLYMADTTHALLVGSGGLIVSYGYGDQSASVSDPARPVPNPHLPGVAYFPETGHTLGGVFRRYWERYGGLAQFGYPLTQEYAEVNETDGKTYTVQYFERARFEQHPEHAGTPYEVLLGLLGRTVTAQRTGETPFLPTGPSGQPGAVYFPETGHSMAPQFVAYWRSHGGLAIYGYPISEAFEEVNAADGHSYLVQYFERNRFEHHPEHAGTPYEVLLGLLGSEVLAAKRR